MFARQVARTGILVIFLGAVLLSAAQLDEVEVIDVISVAPMINNFLVRESDDIDTNV